MDSNRPEDITDFIIVLKRYNETLLRNLQDLTEDWDTRMQQITVVDCPGNQLSLTTTFLQVPNCGWIALFVVSIFVMLINWEQNFLAILFLVVENKNENFTWYTTYNKVAYWDPFVSNLGQTLKAKVWELFSFRCFK